MAMLTIKKFIGFFRVFVLKTIISMKVFPAKETENGRQQARVLSLFAAGLLQFDMD